MGSFAFDVNHGEKIMNIMVEGMFSPQDAEAYICEYNKNVSKIEPKKFEVMFDATKLKCTSQEVLPLLENCMNMYKQAGFKKIKMSMGNSTIVKSQVKRVIDKAGLTNVEIL